jgi:hypothetical protein
MQAFLKNNFVVLIALLMFVSMTARVWHRPGGVIWSDAEGYYNYNPAVFILKDLHKMPARSLPMHQNEKGEFFNKYTCGVAILQMPFFWATRAFCLLKNQQPDEIFSIHYCRGIAVAGYFYGFAGLFFLERAMRRKFGWLVRFITIVTLFTGTNLHYYITKEGGMSHTYSFFLFAMVVWLLPQFYEKPTLRRSAILGLLVGWILLIRPTSVLILLFVIGYDAMHLKGLAQRLIWWLKQPKYLLAASIGALLIWSPQIYYWHEILGKYFVYSYKGESFLYWKQPKIGAVLFDTQNGLFLFSPIVLFMVLAIWFCRKDPRAQSLVLAPIFILATYLFASWWCWNFGGAFGHRSYIEFYALFALPYAVLVERVLNWKILWAKIAVGVLWFLLCAYSVKMSYLYSSYYGPWDGPNWRWNWKGMFDIWNQLFKR